MAAMRVVSRRQKDLLDQLNGPLGRSSTLTEAIHNSTQATLPADVVNLAAAELEEQVPEFLLQLIPLAAVYADPALSGYSVGCVARATSGGVYLGANAEFPPLSLNLTIHAEQAAVINAWEHGENGLRELAVGAAPCGQCRQFLYETKEASELLVFAPNEKPARLPTLLPEAFGPQDLGVEACLMASQHHELSIAPNYANDRLVATTKAAAELSYAPYSGAYAAVSLLTSSGEIFTGRYAENAAFNPSVLPSTAALTILRLAGASPEEIVRGVLVERRARLSHSDISRLHIKNCAGVDLEVVTAD